MAEAGPRYLLRFDAFRLPQHLTDVLVVALSGTDEVALMNRKAASLAGTSSELAHGRSLLDCWIPDEDRAAMRAALAETRAQNRAIEVETGFVDKASGPTPPRAKRVRWHLSRSRDAGDLVAQPAQVGAQDARRNPDGHGTCLPRISALRSTGVSTAARAPATGCSMRS